MSEAIYAVIIAGGRGERLGGACKADLRIGGVRLIERVASVLRGAEHPMLVATGPAGREMSLPPGWEPVSDLAGSGGGPLAGLVGAVHALAQRGIARGTLISAAVDTPFLPDDYVSRLVGGLEGAPVAFGAWGNAFYPPNAAWRLQALADLPERAKAAGSLKALQQALGGRRVGWDELALNPFDNVNTPTDLRLLEERARRERRL
ncbi:MAG: hypothetical protein JWP99_808 [Devosia sp.]|nr:hypothetical protein [Devosia sp.]